LPAFGWLLLSQSESTRTTIRRFGSRDDALNQPLLTIQYSIVPEPGVAVHGVVWSLTPRDLAALNAYECLHRRLYVRRILPVVTDGRRRSALVYVAPGRVPGRPQPGYQELVVAAARDWSLPEKYVESLSRLICSGLRGALTVATGEMG